MKVAKLSTGRIVQFIKKSPVLFDDGIWALVCPQLIPLTCFNNDPYWVPELQVAWIMEF